MNKIDGAYNPLETEGKIYANWEKSGYFNPDNLPGKRDKNYVVYMPLPNVTGTLHMGHTLNNSFQDIVIRFHRMRGYKTLYLPGTDHAGIATQYVVEKKLKKEGKTRFDLGREKFIEEVWKWKNEYGNIIYDQLKKIGVSCDWSRTRFTMDPNYAKDVEKAFIHYYEKGFLYRGQRTINWCPRCATSLSDLELEYKEEEGKLYYIKYGPFTLATTRPETKFGDTGIAVHPDDTRYKHLIGKEIEIEGLSTEGTLDVPQKKHTVIHVVGDESVDRDFGTGAVKVTPAHDILDFEIGQRHNLPTVQVIDARGVMNDLAGKYAGMKTKEAREKIIEDLSAVHLLEKIEDYNHNVAVCYRCGQTIEPIPSVQWFLKMDALAKRALESVKENRISITPDNFEKTYSAWLENIRDWTISRQIWWGHRLPVYFCKNNPEIDSSYSDNFVVATEKPDTCPFCKKCEMEQSPDVLDTWFSSALWPFAGLSEKDIEKYYPGTALITARDILNLWVARMIYSGIEFHKTEPFQKVLIHGTILTKDGKRMSKSLGTGIDPLKYVDEFGADATRFGIVWQATGQDIRWDESAVQAGKKFANKIWNAGKYIEMQIEKYPNGKSVSAPKTEADANILTALAKIKKGTEEDITAFEFSRALHNLYDFFWHDFCDIYLEASKKQMDNETSVGSTIEILTNVLRESLKLLHPFMPFVTEEIYSRFPFENKAEFLMIENIE